MQLIKLIATASYYEIRLQSFYALQNKIHLPTYHLLSSQNQMQFLIIIAEYSLTMFVYFNYSYNEFTNKEFINLVESPNTENTERYQLIKH